MTLTSLIQTINAPKGSTCASRFVHKFLGLAHDLAKSFGVLLPRPMTRQGCCSRRYRRVQLTRGMFYAAYFPTFWLVDESSVTLSRFKIQEAEDAWQDAWVDQYLTLVSSRVRCLLIYRFPTLATEHPWTIWAKVHRPRCWTIWMIHRCFRLFHSLPWAEGYRWIELWIQQTVYSTTLIPWLTSQWTKGE